jgi:hypothetical protein
VPLADDGGLVSGGPQQLHAPAFTVSRPDGQLRAGADGFYHGERRALARLEISTDRVPAAPIAGGLEGADRALFRTVLRGVAETTADPPSCWSGGVPPRPVG